MQQSGVMWVGNIKLHGLISDLPGQGSAGKYIKPQAYAQTSCEWFMLNLQLSRALIVYLVELMRILRR